VSIQEIFKILPTPNVWTVVYEFLVRKSLLHNYDIDLSSKNIVEQRYHIQRDVMVYHFYTADRPFLVKALKEHDYMKELSMYW